MLPNSRIAYAQFFSNVLG